MLKTQLELAQENLNNLIKSLENWDDPDLLIEHIIDDVVLKERLEVIKGLLEEYKRAENE